MRKLMIFCVAAAAAIFAARYGLPAEWLIPSGAVCLLLGGAAALFLRGDARRRCAIAAAGLVLGFVWTAGYHALFVAPGAALDNQITAVDATVLDFPRATDYGYAVTVRVPLAGHTPVRAVLYTDGACADLRPGDSISLSALFRRVPTGADDPGYQSAKGIFLQAYARSEIAVTPCAGIPPLACLPALSGRWFQDLFRAVFSDEARGLVVPIVTGNLDEMPPTLYAALRRTGLAHAVSVSGMHVSFLAAMLFFLLGSGRRGAAVCIPVILLFTVVVGCPPGMIRAAVMYSILLLAPLLRRETDTPTSLAFALFLLLLHNPYAAGDIGLQLSFAATAGIAALAQPICEGVEEKLPAIGGTGLLGRAARGAVRFITSAVAVTAGALVFTVPLTAFYFGMVSVVTFLASVLVLWAVTATFVLGLAAGFLGLVWLPLGGAVARIAAPVIHYQLWLIPRLAALPLAAVTMDSVYYRGWVVLVYAVVGLTFVCKGWRKPLVPLACCLVALAAAALFTRMDRQTGALTVAAIDVGQGQSVVLLSGGYAAVVDCGGNTSERAGDVVADYLQDMGIGRVDLLILTHYHADHANGVPALMARLEVGNLLLPDVTPDDALRQAILAHAATEGAQVRYITAASDVPFGAARLTLYPPLGDGGANEEGLMILADAGDFEALITGDANAAVEQMLIDRYPLPDIELLVVGHHGSKYSTSAALLDAARPEYAFISSGRNTYGHPTPETMARLDEAGAEIYRTDLMGTVALTVK